MRITIRLDSTLLDQARREALNRGTTVTVLIEQGLRLVLAGQNMGEQRRRVTLPICRAGGGTLPGVNLDDSGGLLDRLDGRQPAAGAVRG